MANSELEIVVEDPTAPDENSPAVTDNRTVEMVVMALLFGLAVLLGFDNWRTGASWDATGPEAGGGSVLSLGDPRRRCALRTRQRRNEAQRGTGNLRHPRAIAPRVAGVRADADVLSRDAVARPLCRELPADRGLHGDRRQDRVVEVAAYRLHLRRDHVRNIRHRL